MSRPKPDPESLVFGKEFSDHMLEVDWVQGQGWSKPKISPLHNLSIHPAAKVLHYSVEVRFCVLGLWRGIGRAGARASPRSLHLIIFPWAFGFERHVLYHPDFLKGAHPFSASLSLWPFRLPGATKKRTFIWCCCFLERRPPFQAHQFPNTKCDGLNLMCFLHFWIGLFQVESSVHSRKAFLID